MAREHENKDQFTLECEIYEICGIHAGPHPKGSGVKVDEKYYWDIDSRVCEWMRKLGADEGKISRIGAANGGRANCYCAGARWFKEKVVNDSDSSHRPKSEFRSNSQTKVPRTPRGFGRVDTSDFSFDNDADKSLPELLGIPQPRPDLDYHDNQSDEAKITVTQEMLKKATDAILGPQVEAFKAKAIADASTAIRGKLAELDLDIENRVKVEIAGERTEATNRAINAATNAAVEAAIKAAEDFIIKRVPRRIELYTPTETRLLTDEPRHKAFDEVLFLASQGIHVYMWGPKGTGKTHLFPQVAEALGRKYYPIGQSLSKYDVTGYTSATGDYIKTHARDAMEFGGVLGVDEGDTWAAAALIALNTPLANRYCPFPDKVINVHKDFLCILAANTSGFGATPEFPGRNPLDSTSTDRFAFVHVDYDEDLEIQLFGNTPWVRYLHDVRTYVRQELKQTAALPSMRPIQMGTKLLAAGGDPDLVAKWVLWKGLPQDMINRIESRCGKFGRRHLQEVEAAD
jgi:MoxR-like ATPase